MSAIRQGEETGVALAIWRAARAFAALGVVLALAWVAVSAVESRRLAETLQERVWVLP